jgi:hypothetical protein
LKVLWRRLWVLGREWVVLLVMGKDVNVIGGNKINFVCNRRIGVGMISIGLSIV